MSDDIVNVRLGPRAYDIVIGADVLERAGALLKPHASQGRVFVVSDRNVWRAQGPRLAASLKRAGLEFAKIVVAPGEATKSFRGLERLLNTLIESGAERSDLVVAFGGGVVGDLAGLAAALMKRGCRSAQVPTSLLAMADSAIGGKTAINVAAGKNLVGAFHQPAIVLADVGALQTLPDRDMRAGYAEIVKYGAMADAGFFAWLEANAPQILARDPAALIHAVKRACEMKAAIVAEDERDEGRRLLLNLGHTFGHALEAAAGYSGRLLHGEAVAAGMGLAFDFSVTRGLCRVEDARRLKSHLRAAGLPAGVEDAAAGHANASELLALMRRDKKAAGGALALVLARRIGEAFVAQCADEPALLEFLEAKTAERTDR